MGAFKVAAMLSVGAGKTALLVAKHFALDELRRNSAAVNGKNGLFFATAQFMYGLRHHFFPGAAFPGDQYRSRRGRNFCDLIVNPLHHRRYAQQFAESPEGS